MNNLGNFSVKVRHFKCFGKDEQGFECIKPINIIIGRNNSGKSALLDLIEYVVENNLKIPENLWHSNVKPDIILGFPLTEDELKKVFQENARSGNIPGRSHWEFGKQFIGVRFKWRIGKPNETNFISIADCHDGTRPLDKIDNAQAYLDKIASKRPNLLVQKEYRRIHAERSINPEPNKSEIKISGDGTGTTNIIQNFINKANLPRDLVEKTLLNDLNFIFKTDAHFTDIVCQELENGQWEIYLEEESKGLIALSQSGSGLKTVILVLVYIHLLPVVLGKDLSQFIFGFEELENNLHPALQRRLLSYLHGKAREKGCVFFLTTHSNVEIDFFSKNEDAQIIHVTHNGEYATTKTVKTYFANQGILDDLDIRASDLLQANGIIWVEGPSDRIYLRRWIDLWSGEKLVEGTHYQCMFYGGRLLAHLSSSDPDLNIKEIPLLRINQNGIVVIDSDKRNKNGRINDTKRRIKKEIEDLGGIAWITKGKEIENYLSADLLSKWLKKKVNQVDPYADFFDYLDGISTGKGKKYRNKKPLLAETLNPFFEKAHLENILDLKNQLEKVCTAIKAWNKIEDSEETTE